MTNPNEAATTEAAPSGISLEAIAQAATNYMSGSATPASFDAEVAPSDQEVVTGTGDQPPPAAAEAPPPVPVADLAASPTEDRLGKLAKAEEERRFSKAIRERDELLARIASQGANQAPPPAPKPGEPKTVADIRRLLIADPNAAAQALGLSDANKLARLAWGKTMGNVDVSQETGALTLVERLEATEAQLRSFQEKDEERHRQSEIAEQQNRLRQSLASEIEPHLEAMPFTRAFFGSEREKSLDTLRELSTHLRATDPHMSDLAVGIEMERRLAAASTSRMKQLEDELATWRAATGTAAPTPAAPTGKTAPPGAPPLAKTLTRATAAGSSNPNTAPKTPEQLRDEAVRKLKESMRVELADEP